MLLINRLHARPEAETAAVVAFPSVEKAVAAVVEVLQCSIPVARIELIDVESVKVERIFVT